MRIISTLLFLVLALAPTQALAAITIEQGNAPLDGQEYKNRKNIRIKVSADNCPVRVNNNKLDIGTLTRPDGSEEQVYFSDYGDRGACDQNNLGFSLETPQTGEYTLTYSIYGCFFFIFCDLLEQQTTATFTVGQSGQPGAFVRISHPGVGVTCQPSSITLTPCTDASCSQAYTDPLEISLLGSGWIDGTTLTLNGSSQSVRYQQTQPGTYTLGVESNGNESVTQGCANAATGGKSCDMVFSDSALLVSVPDVVAGKPTEGTVEAVKSSNTSDRCVAAFSSTTKTIRFDGSYSMPTASNKAINLPVFIDGNSVDLFSGSDVPVNFDGAGIGRFQLRYADAGEVSLKALFSGPPEAGAEPVSLSGADAFVSSPAGTCMRTTGSCPSGDSSCQAQAETGEALPFSFEAVAWESDSDTNYCQGNDATPSFSGTVPIQHSLVAPASGVEGAFSATSVPTTPNQTGEHSFNGSFNRVGVFSVKAQDFTYLGKSVAGHTAAIAGRITPSSFALSVMDDGLVAPRCSFSTEYLYQGEPINWSVSPMFKITALNHEGAAATNYTIGGFKKLSSNNVEVAYSSQDVSATDTEGNPMVITSTTSQGDLNTLGAGEMSFEIPVSDTITYSKTADTLITPFSPAFNVSLVTVEDPDLVSNDTIVLASPTSSQEVAYGRTFLENAFGPDGSVLEGKVVIESYETDGFQRTTSENCFSYSASDISSSDTTVAEVLPNDPVITAGVTEPEDGIRVETFTGNQADVEITLTVDSFMQHDWNGDGSFSNPTATYTVGVYRGNDRVIYWREI